QGGSLEAPTPAPETFERHDDAIALTRRVLRRQADNQETPLPVVQAAAVAAHAGALAWCPRQRGIGHGGLRDERIGSRKIERETTESNAQDSHNERSRPPHPVPPHLGRLARLPPRAARPRRRIPRRHPPSDCASGKAQKLRESHSRRGPAPAAA